ncbi:MAG: hypothetical protein AB8B61_10055 [Cyclobacteriaceae bacterium]
MSTILKSNSLKILALAVGLTSCGISDDKAAVEAQQAVERYIDSLRVEVKKRALIERDSIAKADSLQAIVDSTNLALQALEEKKAKRLAYYAWKRRQALKDSLANQ